MGKHFILSKDPGRGNIIQGKYFKQVYDNEQKSLLK